MDIYTSTVAILNLFSTNTEYVLVEHYVRICSNAGEPLLRVSHTNGSPQDHFGYNASGKLTL
jgi:hypothetical protein